MGRRPGEGAPRKEASGAPPPRPPQPAGQEGTASGAGTVAGGAAGWEAAPDIKSLAGTMDGEAVPGGTRGSSFMEAATIPSSQERVIKQVNKAMALLKSSAGCGAGRGSSRGRVGGGNALPELGVGGGRCPALLNPPGFTGHVPLCVHRPPREGDPSGSTCGFHRKEAPETLVITTFSKRTGIQNCVRSVMET